MFEWYWGLSGFTWFFVTLLMGGGFIGSMGLLVILAARSITGAFDHDPQTCTCPGCEGKRARQLNRQARSSDRLKAHVPEYAPGTLVSTAELRPGMRVTGNKSSAVYEFQGLQKRSYGYTVVFINIANRKQAWVIVPLPRMHVRMWKLTADGIRHVYGL